MVSYEAIENYKDKIRAELRTTERFAKDARKELGKGNFNVAMTQVLEAEKHLTETKNLLKEINKLDEMEKTNTDVRKDITLAKEINENNRQLEELEKQLTEVKEMATREVKPESEKEEEEKYHIKV